MTTTLRPATALDRVNEALAARGSEGKNGTWLCPAHDDSTPSLSVGPNKAGDGVVLHCHAGCPSERVLARQA